MSALTPAQKKILRLLRHQGPLRIPSVSILAEISGDHARRSLEILRKGGLVTRKKVPVPGRKRRVIYYKATN